MRRLQGAVQRDFGVPDGRARTVQPFSARDSVHDASIPRRARCWRRSRSRGPPTSTPPSKLRGTAQRKWAALTGTERGRILRRAADILRARNAELAELETRDTGKPIQETSVVDVVSGADCLEYFAGVAPTLAGEHLDLGPAAFGYTRREPLGVVAGIGAWNYPLQIACWKSAPALACGNAMIFKPADLTPLTAIKLREVLREAGLPEGLFQVVQGFGETGRLLSQHPGIDKVSRHRLGGDRQGGHGRCRRPRSSTSPWSWAASRR